MKYRASGVLGFGVLGLRALGFGFLGFRAFRAVGRKVFWIYGVLKKVVCLKNGFVKS